MANYNTIEEAAKFLGYHVNSVCWLIQEEMPKPLIDEWGLRVNTQRLHPHRMDHHRRGSRTHRLHPQLPPQSN